MPNYKCNACDYNTDKKSNYDKHNNSKKHFKNILGKVNCNYCGKWLSKRSMIYHAKYVCNSGNKTQSNDNFKYKEDNDKIIKTLDTTVNDNLSISNTDSSKITELENRLDLVESQLKTEREKINIIRGKD